VIEGASQTARQCRICGKNTSELKPYCMTHVAHHEHAAEVAAELKRRKDEIRLAIKGEVAHILTTGTVAEDVIRVVVSEGVSGATHDKIVRSTNMPLTAVKAYVSALKRAGLVRVTRARYRCAARVIYLGDSDPGPLPRIPRSPRGAGPSLPAAQADGLTDQSVPVQPELAEDPADHPESSS
jgi:hypothetical protein